MAFQRGTFSRILGEIVGVFGQGLSLKLDEGRSPINAPRQRLCPGCPGKHHGAGPGYRGGAAARFTGWDSGDQLLIRPHALRA